LKLGSLAGSAKLVSQFRPVIVGVPLLTLLTGTLFPLLLFFIGRPLFPRQAGGSLILRSDTVIGSALIGQQFTRPEYFHGRPSAAGSGYDAAASGGTDLGPDNRKLIDGAAGFAGIRQLADQYRQENGMASGSLVPIDAVTRSASGLDPHISPANAWLQVPRVARARGMSESVVRRLVAEHTVGRQLGFLGDKRVSVLDLNLALDRLVPRGAPVESR
jgi:potassium-transporting ATPase KdpC subunit